MRETPDTGRKRMDLSVPQVAGSALAAVVAAKLASYFGVYGTILGAGVVSVVATCGGTVFQHFFKRTGEQLREAKTAPRPRAQLPPATGDFTEGTVYRARVRGWRRPVVAAAVVFGVTMAGISTWELVSGNRFGGGGGTTVSDAVTGRSPAPRGSGPSSPAKSGETGAPSGKPSSGRTPSVGTGARTGGSPDPAPSGPTAGPSGGDASTSGPSPAPSGSAATPTPPAPSASSRSGTAVPDPAGSAAP
ncbi:hypothetical protein ACF1AB_26720 [Streptomyces sp. NPDC014846]|uniref:hypothetical protein n=1 Tax=Streptomyces sp. NPDC014846 TaxID=3364922 RepID=UPI0036FFE165